MLPPSTVPPSHCTPLWWIPSYSQISMDLREMPTYLCFACAARWMSWSYIGSMYIYYPRRGPDGREYEAVTVNVALSRPGAYTTLYYTILCYTISYYTMLYYILSYYFVLDYIVPSTWPSRDQAPADRGVGSGWWGGARWCTPSPQTKSFPTKSPWVKLSGRPPIKLYGHENSHPLELRVCLGQALWNRNS